MSFALSIEAINLGSGKDHKVIDMANKINALTGNEAGINYVARRDWDAKTKLLSSIDKAKDILEYLPNFHRTSHEFFQDPHRMKL